MRLIEVLRGPVELLDQRHGIRALLTQAASDQGLVVQPLVETASIALLIRYVAAGIGATFLPRFAATAQAARGDLAVVELEDETLRYVSAHLMVRARRRLPKSVVMTANFLAKRMQAFTSDE
ncbi:MAG: LysR substrate-binding domain-containing protein [Breoghania sp.]|nr:LysR substrate-binding domain-containing protein [Breoghania sp.]MDJ0931521.1 LysR substrate-binding domain-containing protein [Breoghania sp.]